VQKEVMNASISIVAAIATLGLSVPAFAAEPSAIMGKWIERFANGKGMVTEFLPNAISSYPVDEAGKPRHEPQKLPVKYKDLGNQEFSITFGDGGGILLHLTSVDSATLDFPGVGAHNLTRLSAN
jgi:hypothetical protein